MLVVIVLITGIVLTIMMMAVDSGGGGCDVTFLDHTIMKSVNLSKLCMEENDSALKQVIHCNHGILLHLKTSRTSSNLDRRYWACPYYGGPRSCDFWRWRDSEDIDLRSKYVIPKLIKKLDELENVVESCRFNEVEKLIGLSKSIMEGSEKVDKPKESKHDDNGINMKLEKLEEEIRKIKEKEKNWKRIAEGRTRDNTHFFVVFFCCILVIASNYLVGMLFMKNGSIRLP
ncbi:putative MATE efflux family protein 5-like [Capsicum annuum]|nr:putative MATE efflux family protein 5-like [Capsicum annuum]